MTRAIAALINPEDPKDPIAAQFVPSEAELNFFEDELADPIGDAAHSPVKGIVHRYPDRVLLTLANVCPAYCRFCFRRERVGKAGAVLRPSEIDRALAYIRERQAIWEVILSGGDPFVLSDRRLGQAIGALNAIDHVRVLRVHTRVPVVMPERITPELVAILRAGKPVYVLLHCNHARELTPQARDACARLIDAGIPMLSQSVLLRGVNDDPESLRELMRALVETRVKPHYLHHGDLARGTGHFRTSIAKGQALLRGLRGHLSGLCQPTYILDIPGGYGKVPIGPAFIEPDGQAYRVQDIAGNIHMYRDSAPYELS